ncbi:hypothetical protein AB4G91_06805 [Macrococcoides goetzii]|uniref:hypothetical protein n=1 Tax=Macrococcus sp. PK TaxID=2801919 RepID=UPI001F0DEC59|nr:hypothetical protein [Macrococcus sp. PK]MCH4984924.1 hypothetical protein [Macrococcus sp. PK]
MLTAKKVALKVLFEVEEYNYLKSRQDLRSIEMFNYLLEHKFIKLDTNNEQEKFKLTSKGYNLLDQNKI